MDRKVNGAFIHKSEIYRILDEQIGLMTEALTRGGSPTYEEMLGYRQTIHSLDAAKKDIEDLFERLTDL